MPHEKSEPRERWQSIAVGRQVPVAFSPCSLALFSGCHWLCQCRAAIVATDRTELSLLWSHCPTTNTGGQAGQTASATLLSFPVKTLAKPVAPEEEVQELLRLQASLHVFRADLPVHDWPATRFASLRSGTCFSHPPRCPTKKANRESGGSQ